MVAEILVMAKRPEQALAEYEVDLKINPNRTLSQRAFQPARWWPKFS